jgi:hypothetical protein
VYPSTAYYAEHICERGKLFELPLHRPSRDNGSAGAAAPLIGVDAEAWCAHLVQSGADLSAVTKPFTPGFNDSGPILAGLRILAKFRRKQLG